MLVEKYIDRVKGASIVLMNDHNAKLTMYYSYGNLCFTLNKYTPDNVFYIMAGNELYESLENLFRDIRKCDTLHFLTPNRNSYGFEWLSDGYGVPGTQNRLNIQKQNNLFKIHFIKNKLNELENNSCTVYFSLTNSNYQEIANAFDDMFANAFRATSRITSYTKKKTLAATK